MVSKLEHITYRDVIDTQGTSYSALRKQLKPVYSKVWKDIAKGYGLLLLIVAADLTLLQTGYFLTILVLPVSSFLIGYCLAYLHLFIHAAAHYDLHPEKLKNDRISDIFIGIFFGISIKNYRKIHWLHHEHLGKKNDSEHSYFNELNLLFLLKSVTGVHTIHVMLNRLRLQDKNRTNKKFSYHTVSTAAFHTLLLSLLLITGGWLMLLTWLLGLIIVFPFLAAIRQLLEHRDTAAQKINYAETDHGEVSRLFGKGLIDSSFGAAGFNKHLLHHWDPAISYTRLKEVEEFLLNCPATATIIQKNRTSYLKTFIALFKI